MTRFRVLDTNSATMDLFNVIHRIGETLTDKYHILLINDATGDDKAITEYRVYHNQGYCFNIERFCDYYYISNGDDAFMITYSFNPDIFDGFKNDITASDALDLFTDC